MSSGMAIPLSFPPQGRPGTSERDYVNARIIALLGGADVDRNTLKKLGDMIAGLSVTSVQGLAEVLADKASSTDLATITLQITEATAADLALKADTADLGTAAYALVGVDVPEFDDARIVGAASIEQAFVFSLLFG